jgi:hypothetical protein
VNTHGAHIIPLCVYIEETTTLIWRNNMGCPVCDAKSLGAAKIRACNLGTSTPYIVAAELKCTYEEVMTHINEGHELRVDEKGKMHSEDELLKKLSTNMNILDEWAGFIIQSVTKPEQIDGAKVNMLVRLTQEIRKTVESIAELQGRKGPGDTLIQLQIVNNKFTTITNLVLDNCCPSCQMKILDAIDRDPMLSGGVACQENVLLSPVKLLPVKTDLST